MNQNTSDRRILDIQPVMAPLEIIEEFPASELIREQVSATRQKVGQILHRKDDRLLVIVGPCSVHDPDAACEYGERLIKLREELNADIEVLMRVYFEKPRTTVGWKGLINDPNLDGSFEINKGLRMARKLLIDINQMGLPAATEFLDIVTGQYYADLISWGAIGARTTESQVHRELASGLSCPVGFKNGTDGNLQIAVDAVNSALSSHIFLSPTHEGKTAIYKTTGNPDAHIILRGGKTPNYDRESVADALSVKDKAKVETGLIVDFSHANSRKQFERQMLVGEDVAHQISSGQDKIAGCMIESHLVEGRQNVVEGETLTYGQSITDACIGWSATEDLLHILAESVRNRRKK